MSDSTHQQLTNVTSVTTSDVVPLGEGCPPPLAWADVLRSVHAQSTSWACTVEKTQLRGRVFGEGSPLYILPGMCGNTELMCLFVWLLRDTHRCVMWDYPTAAEGRHSRAQLADYVLAIADHLGDQEFTIYATSFGGLIAMEAMLAAPERIIATVLQGAFAYRKLSFSERLLVRVSQLLPMTLEWLPGRIWVQRQNNLPWFPPLDHSRFQFFLENTGRSEIRAIGRRAAIIRDSDLRSRLPEIQQPVLLIEGEGDGLVSGSCQDVLEAGLKNVKRERLLNSGHIPYLTHPHRIAKLTREFLEGVGTTSASRPS